MLSVDSKKLFKNDKESISLFNKQLEQNGWCVLTNISSIKKLMVGYSTYGWNNNLFFNTPQSYKDEFIMKNDKMGYIKSYENERYKLMTGNKYYLQCRQFAPKCFNDLLFEPLKIDEIATTLLNIICNAFNINFNCISSQNEICLVRDKYHKQKYLNDNNIISIICHNWFNSKRCDIPNDINRLIIQYLIEFDGGDIKNANFGILEFIQYNKCMDNDKSLLLKEYNYNGFATICLGSNNDGLQLFDRRKNKYIIYSEQYKKVFICIGKRGNKILNNRVPVGLFRLKKDDKSTQETRMNLYKICMGDEIKYLSYDYGLNWIQSQNLESINFSCIKDKKDGNYNKCIQGPCSLNIKALNGNKYEINYDPNKALKAIEIKYFLQETEGIKKEGLRLIFKGRLMNDSDTVQSFGIYPGSTINCAICGTMNG